MAAGKMRGAEREVALREQFLAAREMMEMLKRLRRLIDALEERSDEELSKDEAPKVEIVREYRQAVTAGIRVMQQSHVAIEDAQLFGAVEAGIAALESGELAEKFMKGMVKYMDDADDDPE